VLLCGLAILLLWPVAAIVAILVAVRLGRPIVFQQDRSGQFGRTFRLYKFRTMRELRDARGESLPDASRLTTLGQFLRRYSLDELPQLWNVLRGDMSLVGPRPLLPQYLDRYSPRQRRRLEVPPGITGWVQIMGRNTLTWDEKFELDVWYVDHASLGLDVRILWGTLGAALLPAGISAPDHATMPEFQGSVSAATPAPGNLPLPRSHSWIDGP